VYYPNSAGEDVIAALAADVGPDIQILQGDQPPDYEVLINGRATVEMVGVPSLRTLIVPFAGVNDATLNHLRKNPRLKGYNLHHNASDTAETALALLLSAVKLIVPIDQRLRKNDWGSRYEEVRALGLEGRSALILGFGQIGQRIGRALVAMGLNVKAIRRGVAPSPVEGVTCFASERLRDLLTEAQVLMIALPMTAATTAMIGEREIAMMPRGAVLVNIARGPIVDEEALYNALKSGHLHSAGLDVWYQYPQAPDNSVPGYFDMPDSAKNTPPSKMPFGELDNVVMSPHRGGTSADTERFRVRDLAAVLRALKEGEEPDNRIDVEAGY
jgi:phosphoglycerate dehydrogenase-like enzyme